MDAEDVPAESVERIEFTDDEYAFLRHARFGELPARVRPDELVALTETDPRRDIPEPVGDLDVARRLRGAA